MSRLHDRSGPVIEDQAVGTMCWLVARHVTREWDLAALKGVECLSDGDTLTVPPETFTGGPALRWLVPVRPGRRVLTDSGTLHAALVATVCIGEVWVYCHVCRDPLPRDAAEPHPCRPVRPRTAAGLPARRPPLR